HRPRIDCRTPEAHQRGDRRDRYSPDRTLASAPKRARQEESMPNIARFAKALLPTTVLLVAAFEGTPAAPDEAYPANHVAGSLIRLNDNGAWSWFMDPRVIVDEGKIIVGSVRAIGAEAANASDPKWGNVEVSVYDIQSGTVQ